ncbi:hypothetical protein BDV93DRAFT_464358 [Ceratobasidium sp. AG-I]|nr:hypothetical protein BDV93DRAFT_464358 [Ceratobasidium sp. AG-I]
MAQMATATLDPPVPTSVSPASTALSVVSDTLHDAARADPEGADGAFFDPDTHKLVSAPEMATVADDVDPAADLDGGSGSGAGAEADDEPRGLSPVVPIVRITETPPTPVSPRASTQTDPLPHSTTSPRASLSAMPATGTTTSRGRRATMDARASNRLSGFFSHLLTTRRNELPPPPLSPSGARAPQSSTRERSASPPGSPVSPAMVPRPMTPPPSLPAPSLDELGLSLSVLTPGLTPAQYAAAPTNGTFLAPHYLLLCHPQGLDVLPLNAPPAPQPYALVRRVAFKSVIVMEERGVLVAIAGRRDGVRVYALEDVRRAVEWRLDLEVKREAEQTRRSKELVSKGKNRAAPAAIPGVNMPASASAPSALSPAPTPAEPEAPAPLPPPPSYASSVNHRPLITRVSTTNLAGVADAHSRARGGSLSSIVGLNSHATMRDLARASTSQQQQKSEWGEVAPSDDEALVAAGPEASAALDERTSAGAQPQPPIQAAPVASPPLQIGGAGRRATVGSHGPEPVINGSSNAGATLSSMRTALAHSRSTNLLPRAPTLQYSELGAANAGGLDSIGLAEMLQESRLPPPSVVPDPAQRRASVVMLQSSSHPVYTGNELEQVNEDTDHAPDDRSGTPRPRRWSFVAPSSASLPNPGTSANGLTPDPRAATLPALTTIPLPPSPSPSRPPPSPTPSRPPPSPRQGSHRSTRSHPIPSLRDEGIASPPPSRRRFIPKLLSAFGAGKKDKSRDRSVSSGAALNGSVDSGIGGSPDAGGAGLSGSQAAIAAAPKLEYIKLPGTKGAIMIKAVETAKKSFLAILCGDSGEKVELFAGTYRTPLGLSRTFILPDSPKSLELQLQGDDLVEVFLVFAQNVFGLEPATVRVREVRIGRNERRAARRRARAGASSGTGTGTVRNGAERPAEIEPTVVTTTVSVGGDDPVPSGTGSRRSMSLARRKREVQGRVTHSANPDAPPPLPSQSAGAPGPSTSANTSNTANTDAIADEMVALTNAQAGPYTTFQQLSFAPSFPLAAIADDYAIPPTYTSFLEYREQFEPDAERVVAAEREPENEEEEEIARGKNKDKNKEVDVHEGREAQDLDEGADEGDDNSEVGVSGSGQEPEPLEDDPAHALQAAPSPAPVVVKWFYLDPKGVVQGPWKPSIMQNWLREGYLPPELPVRRADETEYTLLRDLRAQVEDPSEPFKPVAAPPPPPPAPQTIPATPTPLIAPSTSNQAPADVPNTVSDIVDSTSNTPQPSTSSTPLPQPTAAASEPIPTFSPTAALLKPISLLAQPRHFGPPALFYCSRGGHSTTVVDARGRPVLKGRIHWSGGDAMGDTHRVEAIDVGGRAVLIALRQGGIEATDIGHALLEPADESRTALPNYRVVPGASNRRGPYVWRLGTSINSTGRSAGSAPGKRRAGVSGRKKATATKGQAGVTHDDDSGDESDVFSAQEEGITFLARDRDNIYVCERSAGKFRLLRLSKATPETV